MNKIVKSAMVYMILGLLAGLFYREFPRFVSSAQHVEESQLSILHTHTLTLGLFVFLFILIFAKLFDIHKHKLFNKFFGTYHVGLLLTLLIMLTHGIWVAVGNEPHPAFSGIAGLGHIAITIGFGMFFKILIDQVSLYEKS